MNQHIGKQTVQFGLQPVIVSAAAIAGKKEGEGPLAEYFDKVLDDDKWGEETWDKAESKILKETARTAIDKAGLALSNVDYVLAGDLLNQCVGAHYGMRELNIPFFGLYGACSTMAESLSIGAIIISGGCAGKVACATSSHFCSAEKQYRFPLEYGGQRAPTSQWTVTGSGCAVLSAEGNGPKITHITTGKIVDMGISDLNNMGAAMAPAAVDTLTAHFEATCTNPSDYDLILTGDLGVVGSDILVDLMKREGYDISGKHNDCGKLIFDIEKQDVHAGGSGCGCCASVLCGYIYKQLQAKKLNKIIVMATGALMNPQMVNSGETIPAIAHAVAITA